MSLLDMPDCVLDEIFQYLSYDEIAKKRLVSTKINKICQSLLNRGAVKLRSRLIDKIQKLRPLIPRKESERRYNTADRNIRFLQSIQNKVLLLSYTYGEYIGKNLCCFIPGKVIDMSLSMLRLGTYPQFWFNEHPFLEFSDAVCMADEHFRDQIEPALRKLTGQKHIVLGLYGNTLHQLMHEEKFRERINPTLETPIQIATESPVTTTIDIQQNSKKCQFQNHGNCRKAYLCLNRKYSAALSKVRLSNKKFYNTFLRKVNLSSKAIKKELTDSRKEVADLRRRLEEFESQNRSANVEQTVTNNLVTKTDHKKVLRSGKRLA